MEKFTRILLFIISGALIISLMFNQRSCSKVAQIEDMNVQMYDELEHYLDENGNLNSKIQVIQAENEKLFTKISIKDSTINWLQEVVKDYDGKLNTAIVLSNSTTSSGSTETIYINHYDTIRKDSIVYLYPEYITTWKNKFEIGEIKATKDSIFRNIKISNEYEITLGSIKNGWFKKKEYEVNVKNLNPNTITDELKSFQVTSKPKKISIGIQAGYGLGLNDLKTQPFLGLGIQYNFIGIK